MKTFRSKLDDLFLSHIKMTKVKQFFIILSLVILLNFFVSTINRPYGQMKNLAEEALENSARDPRFAEVYRLIKTHLPKDNMKYILLWTPQSYEPFNTFSDGQRTFLNKRCPNINCYVTTDRSFFGDDNLEKFNAIAFNGRNLHKLNGDIPKKRLPNQIYIYFNQESAENYPVCSGEFDGFFNWTATFRFDSDIVLQYYLIQNSKGDIIGPKLNMQWKEQDSALDRDFENILLHKNKAAAWFVSNCHTISKREKYVAKLTGALKFYNLTVDVYGSCGKYSCPRNENKSCAKKLEKEYFFYLAFENSFDEDYVTEKILAGLQYKTIPIVYGGANYSRFAPPGSYIDARSYRPEELAKVMAHFIASPNLYKQYFKWYKSYRFRNSESHACKLCDALNNKSMVENRKVYWTFRKWWNKPEVNKLCL